jgi:hypothetical protein
MNPIRTLLVTALAAVGLLVITTPAWAHTELESSSPAQGQTLDTAPTEVRLTFGEAVTLPADPISVTGPDGAAWTVGTPTLAGPVVTAPVTATGPAGQYTLKYRVTADDGDTVTGVVSFSLSAPVTPPQSAAPSPQAPATPDAAPPAAAPAQPAADNGGRNPAWVWVLVAVLVVAGGAAAAIRSRRRK